ncbi:MAG: amino acid permease [Candidatus Thermoplasmatota archaeon]
MPPGRLRRDLGLLAATGVVVGTMIGVGIFLGPRVIAQSLTTPGLVMLAWVLGGLFVFCGALTYAELGAMMPESGGGYAYIREAYGPFWAYLNGWSGFAVGKAASVSALAVGFGVFLGLDRLQTILLALVIIVLVTVVNVLGVKLAGRIGVVAMVLKLGALALLIIGGIAVLGDGIPRLASTPLFPARATTSGVLSAFGLALIPVFFAYDGWVNSTQVAEEVRDPERNVPRSLILGTLAVMLVYALANLVYLLALGDEVGASNFAASEAGTRIAGVGAGTFILIAVLVSILGTINAVTLSGPRIGYAMARDGLFFSRVNRLTRFGTPGWSIIVQGLIAAVLVLIPPIGGKPLFDTLLTYIVVDAFLFYALGASCIIVFRRTRPNVSRPYKVPLYPLVPLVFVIGTVLFLLNAFLTSPLESLGGLLIVAAGIPGYLYWRAKGAPRKVSRATIVMRDAPTAHPRSGSDADGGNEDVRKAAGRDGALDPEVQLHRG